MSGFSFGIEKLRVCNPFRYPLDWNLFGRVKRNQIIEKKEDKYVYALRMDLADGKRIMRMDLPEGKRIRHCNSTNNNGVIHEDLLIEILCRLPPKILMRCSCVCRGWYRLIALVCVPRITPSLPLLGIDVYLRKHDTSSGFLKLYRHKIPYLSDSQIPIRLPPLPTDNPDVILLPIAPVLLVDSCSGLELYIHRSKYVLFNPTTEERVPIPFPTLKQQHVAFVALVLDLGPPVDIKIFAFSDAEGALQDLHVFSLMAGKWTEHKVQYELPVDAATLFGRGAYLDAKLFRLSSAGLLLWYNLKVKDNDVDVPVSYDYIKLPSPCSWDRILNTWRCTIGSCMGRLHYARSDFSCRLMGIWMLSVDTRQWTLRHSINLQAVANHPQLVGFLSMSNLPPPFFPQAFDPLSDAIIIWTHYCIFSYHCDSGTLVPLQSPTTHRFREILGRPPLRAFPLVQCLVSLSLAKWGRKSNTWHHQV